MPNRSGGRPVRCQAAATGPAGGRLSAAVPPSDVEPGRESALSEGQGAGPWVAEVRSPLPMARSVRPSLASGVPRPVRVPPVGPEPAGAPSAGQVRQVVAAAPRAVARCPANARKTSVPPADPITTSSAGGPRPGRGAARGPSGLVAQRAGPRFRLPSHRRWSGDPSTCRVCRAEEPWERRPLTGPLVSPAYMLFPTTLDSRCHFVI